MAGRALTKEGKGNKHRVRKGEKINNTKDV